MADNDPVYAGVPAPAVTIPNVFLRPGGSPTPAQIQNMYEYANQLQKQSDEPVRRWPQGVANMVRALVGGLTAHNADIYQQQGMRGGARDTVSGEPTAPNDPSQPTPFQPFPAVNPKVPAVKSDNVDAPAAPKTADASPTGAVQASKGSAPAVGSLSAKYESNGDPGAAGPDNIGWSYGKNQFNSRGSLKDFMRDNPAIASKFAGLHPETPAFAQRWKQVNKEMGPAFSDAQSATLVKRAQPVMGMAAKLGFKTDDRGVNEALLSGSIQHGGWPKVVQRAAAGFPNFKDMTPPQQLSALYQARHQYVAGLNLDPQTKAAVLNRYPREFKDAVAMSGQSAGSPNTAVADAAPQKPFQVASAGANVPMPTGPAMNGQSVGSIPPMGNLMPGSKDAMVTALNGGQPSPPPVQVAGGPAAPKGAPAGAPSVQAPAGQWGPPIIPPGAVPPQTTWTKDALERILANPSVDPKIKDRALQEYRQQSGARSVPYLGGNVLVDPKDPSKQFYNPTPKWSTEKGIGGAEREVPKILTPPGTGPTGAGVQTLDEPTGPAAAPAPSAAPAGADVPPPPLTQPPPIQVTPPPPAGAPAPAVPAPMPPAPPNSGAAIAPVGPVGAAGGDPRAALALNSGPDVPSSPLAAAAAAAAAKPAVAPVETGGDAIKAAQGALQPPPIPDGPPPYSPAPAAANSPMGDLPGGPLATPPPKGPEGEKTAESFEQFNQRSMDQSVTYEQRKELAKKDAESYNKAMTQYSDLGIRAEKALPSLKAADKIIQDPRYYSGVLADPYEWVKKGVSAIGGDPGAAAPMEIFSKILSGNIVTDLKTQLGGLGQIRLAEINLITQSVANKYNTPAANAAVLKMMQREQDQAARVGQIATQYDKGWALNDQDQWVRRSGIPTTAGLEEQVANYTKRHPLLSDQEIAHIQDTFNIAQQSGKSTPNPNVNADQARQDFIRAAKLDAGGDQPAPAGGGTLPPEAVKHLEEGKVTPFQNGQQWMLKNGAPVRVK